MNDQDKDEDDASSANALATLYLSGESVENGEVDIEKTICYLRGVKDVLKYYIEKQDSSLVGKNYSLEVRIRPGSFVTDIVGFVIAGGLIAATAYATSAATQLGKNDIGQKTSAETIREAMRSLKSTIKIAKHFGAMMHRKNFKHDEAKATDINHIELVNHRGKAIVVTQAELDAYRNTPPTKLRELVSLVSKGTSLYVDDKPILSEGSIPESAEAIYYVNKRLFDARDDDATERLVFPELVQDMHVVLEGELTRGNGRTNTLGFSYDGRILKAIPPEGGVKSARSALFGPVRIDAYVDRRSTAKGSQAVLKKPILRIVSIETLNLDEEREAQQSLFVS